MQSRIALVFGPASYLLSFSQSLYVMESVQHYSGILADSALLILDC